MGATYSALNTNVKDVFANELEAINQVVNKVISPNDKFIDAQYNFLHEDVCSNHTLLFERDLNKHLKIDLEGLSGSIYLVPKKDKIQQDNSEVTKQALCEKIAKHFTKILYILSLIKTVYDLEHGGDNSIAGIVQRNITVVDDIMEINYCSVPHKDYNQATGGKINFGHLQGLQFFADHFLTPTEKYLFIDQLKGIFSRTQRYKVENIVCNDNIIDLNTYNDIYLDKYEGKKFVCDKKNKGDLLKPKSVDLMFEVSNDNPVLHSQYCGSKRKVIIALKGREKSKKKVIELYKKMRTNYTTNINAVLEILNKILRKTGDKYVLKDIDNDSLLAIIEQTKKTIIRFYVQSIVDFQSLLDFAKTIPSLNLEKGTI